MNEEEQFLQCFIPCLYDYEKETGRFIWRWNVGGGKKGQVAGRTHDHGYNIISVYRRSYYAHRVVWFIENGYLPKNFIDHVDGDTTNNQISNLRECTHSENMHNSKAHHTNKWGVKGLSYAPKGRKNWVAQVSSKKVTARRLFNNKKDAINWLKEERGKLHGEFTNHG